METVCCSRRTKKSEKSRPENSTVKHCGMEAGIFAVLAAGAAAAAAGAGAGAEVGLVDDQAAQALRAEIAEQAGAVDPGAENDDVIIDGRGHAGPPRASISGQSGAIAALMRRCSA